LILGMVLIAGIIAIIYSSQLPNTYRSEATIVPREEDKTTIPSFMSNLGGFGGIAGDMLGLGSGGSLSKFEVILKSRLFPRKVYEKHKDEIMPALYKDRWNKEEKKWTVNPYPSLQDITYSIGSLVTIRSDKKKGVLSIQADHGDPAFAKEMVEYYLTELSSSLREVTLKDAIENQRFLKDQLKQSSDVLLNEKIYILLAKEIEKETFARAQNPFSFQVIDPPVVSDLDKKIGPNRRQMCFIYVFVALFFSVFLSFFVEYIKNVRSSDEERIERLKGSLKIRSS